jgi:S-adenosylmethionine synthetase
VEVIKGTAGVFDATGVYFKTAKVEQDNKIIYTFLIGYDPKNPMIMEFFNIDIEEGRELRGGDSGKIVLGYGYLEKDRVLPNPYRLNNKITVQDQELRIVGFFEEVGSPQDDAQVYVTREDIELIYPEENNSYGWIIAKSKIIKNITS